MDLKTGKESLEPGQERMMSYRACFQCCPNDEGVDAKVLVHKHITENQELANLVTMLAHNFRINKRLTFLLIEDNVAEEEDCTVSGMDIKRESALNEYLACEMKTIKTEEDNEDDVNDDVHDDVNDDIPDSSDFPEQEDDCETSKSCFKDNDDEEDPGKTIDYSKYIKGSFSFFTYISFG